MSLQVQYNDGQTGKEFMTYLTLSPVQMTFHGTGSSIQASHDQVRPIVCLPVSCLSFFLLLFPDCETGTFQIETLRAQN